MSMSDLHFFYQVLHGCGSLTYKKGLTMKTSVRIALSAVALMLMLGGCNRSGGAGGASGTSGGSNTGVATSAGGGAGTGGGTGAMSSGGASGNGTSGTSK